jgi:nucleotide-binding universal stress UspA family protein
MAFRSVLCVVALDGTDDPLIRFSEEVAQRCDATLVLLHVLPEVSEALLAHGFPGIDDRPLGREVAERRLGQLTTGLSRPYLTAITAGSAYRSIANLAREHKADVVITGRRDGPLSVSLDTGAVLSRVSCPVISVPVGSHCAPEASAVHERLSGVGKS